MYCPNRGRPAKSPALLTMVTILQRRENLSDREAEDRVRYDLRWKYALGLEVNDEGFDHSLLGKFRDRLWQAEDGAAWPLCNTGGKCSGNEPYDLDAFTEAPRSICGTKGF